MPLTEILQVGKREMLADYITRVDAKSKPLLAICPKGPPISNMLVQFQVDNFEEPEDLAVVDGTDADQFDNAVPDRALLKTYGQKVRDTAMVSDLAENVSDVAGLPKGELAEAIMKKLEKLGRSIEAAIASDQEHQEGSGALPYKVRGLGMWLSDNSSQTTFTVPAAFETPSASRNTTTSNVLTEALVNDLLQSVYTQTGKEGQFTLVCGPALRKQFSSFTRVSSGGTNTFSTIRVYSSEHRARSIDNVVDRFKGDFGELELVPSLFNAHTNFGGTSAKNLGRGYVVDPKLVQLCYKRYPRVKQLEDKGAGPRFLVDAIFAFLVKNPLGMGMFAPTAVT